MLGGLREILMTYVDENGNRELREVPQPASAEYLSTLREAETNSRLSSSMSSSMPWLIPTMTIAAVPSLQLPLPRCSGSLGSRGSRAESVYEMGDDYSDQEQVERKRKEVEQ